MVELKAGSALLHLVRGGSQAGSTSEGARSRREERGSRDSGTQRAADGIGGNGEGGRGNREAGRSAGQPASPGKGVPRASSSEPPAAERSEAITCGFCGHEFVEDRTQAACQACPLSKGCGLMRCPHCGYENAKEPRWLGKIKEWIA